MRRSSTTYILCLCESWAGLSAGVERERQARGLIVRRMIIRALLLREALLRVIFPRLRRVSGRERERERENPWTILSTTTPRCGDAYARAFRLSALAREYEDWVQAVAGLLSQELSRVQSAK